MNPSPARGISLLAGTALVSLAVSLALQALTTGNEQQLTPADSQSQLWQLYRWSVNPERRRQAAVLLAAKEKDSPRHRQRLLAGQGWGDSPLAAVVLKLQAQTAEQLGESAKASQRWQALLNRFPDVPAAADAYYSLGRQQPGLRLALLDKHPAHPAALAAALELSETDAQSSRGAVHLARWGVRWPGAKQALKQACLRTTPAGPSISDRQLLAKGLAQLGDPLAALRCLQTKSPDPTASLAIGRALLRGDRQEQRQGEMLLLRLTQQHPGLTESLEAAALLSEPLHPQAELLAALPEPVIERSSAVAAALVRLQPGNLEAANAVIKRWPEEPSTWQLQWDLGREALLNGRWQAAEKILTSVPAESLPGPIAARQEFWWGFAVAKQGREREARQIWERLIHSHPPGYYRWRAASRLGLEALPSLQTNNPGTNRLPPPDPGAWEPLASGVVIVDELWRLGLEEEAWDAWRSQRAQKGEPPPSPEAKIVEGRLRMAIGDDWTGLGQLWSASLRLVHEDCATRQRLHRSQHPYRFPAAIRQAAAQSLVRPELLLAISKQESRFSPGVTSVAGARGVMQLMPATAAEIAERAGIPLTPDALLSAETNINLGARYLANLLEFWQGNPWLTVASYNAGPGAVSDWISLEQIFDPELWVERIPYPETRYYTKKVLGNLVSYLNADKDLCPSSEEGGRKQLPEPDAAEQDSTEGH